MTDDSPEVTVIMVTYGAGESARLAVERLREHPPPSYELIVVDNASPDDTASILRLIDDALLIENDRNIGFAGAVNVGAAHARGRLLLLLNPDAFVLPGWYESLAEAIDLEAGIAAAVPLLERPDGSVVGGAGVVDRAGATREVDVAEKDVSPVVYGSGACLLIDREVFHRVGGLDCRYEVVYFEDIDLSFSLREAGFSTVVVPSSRVEHSHDVSGGSVSRSAEAARNRERFALRWNRELRTMPTSVSAIEPAPPPMDHRRSGVLGRLLAADRHA